MKLSVKTFQLKVESNVEVSTAIISDTLYGASNFKRAAKVGDQRFGAPIEVYEDADKKLGFLLEITWLVALLAHWRRSARRHDSGGRSRVCSG